MQRKTKILAGGAAALLVLAGVSAVASAHMGGKGWHGMGHGGMMGQQMMERYDANKDGKLTQAEIDQNRTQWYGEFDADKNAGLSLDEFKALWMKARGEMIVREFQFFDRDGNGQVTIEEYMAPMSGIVAARDRNGDGALSVDDRRGPRGDREGRHWRKGGGMGGDGKGYGRTMDNDDGGADDEPGEGGPANP